jgi:C4-dicarboxylate-specific signal transduction histidine kinase
MSNNESTDSLIFEARYRGALAAYVDADSEEESQRVAALELGRIAVAQEYSLLDLLAVHHAAISSLLEQCADGDDAQRRLARASGFLTQVAAPFEMAYRGWHELADRLRRANEELESRVAERTAAHRLAEERLDRAQHVAGMGSWELDCQDGRQIWSKELYHLCGLGEGPNGPGLNDITAFIHEDDRERHDKWFAQLEAGDDPGPLEYRIRRPDGECRVLLAEGEAAFVEGMVSKISCTLQDVTDKKAAEARLNQLQTELAHVSRLNELGQMVSALAHEVNQPLTAQVNYLGAARRLLAAGNQQAALQALERTAEQAIRAGQIIQRLRQFARKGETQRRVESLLTTIEEASALALIGIGQGVRLSVRVANDAAEAVIDKIQAQSHA